MARKRYALVLAFALCASLASIPSSPAGTRGRSRPAGASGKWVRISDLNQKNTDQVSLHRTADGVLHAFFLRHDEVSEETDLMHRPIAADGSAMAAVTVENDWNGMADPDVIGTPDGGMRLFFGGIRTGAADPQQWANTTVSDQAGQTWTLMPGSAAEGDSAYAFEMGAGTSLDGTPFFAWGGTHLHRGLNPLDPNYNYMETISTVPGSGYQPDIATDAITGDMFVAWSSLANDAPGIWAHQVDTATGAPVGGPMLMPKVLTEYFGTQAYKFESARVPITGRVGAPGVYIAYHGGYPFANKILLWRVGDEDTEVLKKSVGNFDFDDVGVVAAPDGRLWVYWLREVGDAWRVWVRRSNMDATQFGTTVHTKAPKNADTAWRIVANAQADRIDVVVSSTNDNGLAHYAAQLFPGLSLKANPTTFSGQKTVTFTVLDAGDPVEGAIVTVAGKQCTSDANGECQITLGPYSNKKKLTAKVAKEDYIGVELVLTAKP